MQGFEGCLTLDEAAKALGRTRWTIWNLIRQGKLGYYQHGRQRFFSPEHIAEYVRSTERNVRRVA